MLNRSDRIMTSIFGRLPSWWDKMSDPGDDYDPFGTARKRSPDGIERTEANSQVEQRRSALQKRYPKMKGYQTIQDLPGLTYDPELMKAGTRVIEGKKYDAMVRAERQADQMRSETEQTIRAQRSDLLVPLEQATTINTRTRTVSVSSSATTAKNVTPVSEPSATS
jgi:hypothetical protein